MKKIIAIFMVFASVSTFGPMTIRKTNNSNGMIDQKTAVVLSNSVSKAKIDSFRVKLNDGKIINVGVKEYVIGCIAGEMPVNYEDEALKAQGIAAYTFALYKSELSGKDYDITADYKVDQCYLTDDELKEKWGEKYSENKKRLETIANTISGEWLSYDGKPILAVYHAVSAGMTYSCKDVWGKELPYLKSVDSSYDKLSDNYQSILEFSFADFYGRTEIESKNKSAPEIKINTDKFGRVTAISINGSNIPTSDFCERLELNSQNFSIETKEEKVVVTVRGRGHGVGMSQEGANYLAKSGSSYKEILHHYYQGCRIER